MNFPHMPASSLSNGNAGVHQNWPQNQRQVPPAAVHPQQPMPMSPIGVPPWPTTSAPPQNQQSLPAQPNLQAQQVQQAQMMVQWMAMMQQMQQMQQQANANATTPQLNSVPNQLADHSQPFAPSNQHDQDLAKVLYESKIRSSNYKTAIESLHMRHGHNADAWKNYFLLHFHRIDALVKAMYAQNARPTETRPAIKIDPTKQNASSFKKSPAPQNASKLPSGSTSKALPQPVGRPHKSKPKPKQKSAPPTPAPAVAIPAVGRRKTLNSLFAPPMSVLPPEVPVNTTTGLPLTPSRSPSPPPAHLVRKPQGRGTRYVPEDEIFFYKYITWKLKGDPELSKSELCDLLAEQIPDHSSQSWSTFWRKNENVADKILFNAGLEESDEPSTLAPVRTTSSRQARQFNARLINKAIERNRLQKQTSDADSDSEVDAEGESDSDDQSADPDYGTPGDDDDDDDLGEPGSSFGTAEMRALAKHIASVPGWKDLKGTEKWEEFCKKYPQRSIYSWKEYYRRKEDDIDELACKYSKRKARLGSFGTQRGRPSWAPSRDTKPAKKRELRDDGSNRGWKKIRPSEDN